MMAELLVSPTLINKMKTRNAARKIKNGSPKLQEQLRERCRKRLREKRGDLFCKFRLSTHSGFQEVQNELFNIVHNEFNDLHTMECSNELQNQPNSSSFADDSIEEELEILEDEEEKWIFEEYQRMLQLEIQSLMSMENDVVCPMCQKNKLQECQNTIYCCCGIKLSLQFRTFQDFKNNLQQQSQIHSNMCPQEPMFSITDNTFCMLCDNCNMFAVL